MSKTYKTHLLTFTAAFAGLFATSQASAALVVYDGFEYDISESASLDGKGSAGNGWVGSWAGNANIVEDNMSYTGGSININGGNQAVSITGNSSALFTRQFATIGTTPGEDIYFSFLFKEVSGTQSNYLNFALSQTNSGIVNSAGIGTPTTSYKEFGARIYGDDDNNFSYGPTFETNVTYFLVGKISRNGTSGPDDSTFDQIELWVNPTSTDLGAASIVIDLSTDVDESEGFSFFGLRTVYLNDTTDDYRFDELRIGTDIASVVAVPEPSTYALLFGFVALLSMIIRRRNK